MAISKTHLPMQVSRIIADLFPYLKPDLNQQYPLDVWQ